MAVIQYTGGTTGESKGAMLTHANLSSIVFIYYRWYRLAQSSGGGGDAQSQPLQNRFLVVLPLVHILGLSCVMLLSVASGSKMILHLRFDAVRVMSDIDRKKGVRLRGHADDVQGDRPTFASRQIRSFVSACLQLRRLGAAGADVAKLRRYRRPTARRRLRPEPSFRFALQGRCQPPARPSAANGTVGLPVPRTLVEVVDMESGMTVLPAGETGGDPVSPAHK